MRSETAWPVLETAGSFIRVGNKFRRDKVGEPWDAGKYQVIKAFLQQAKDFLTKVMGSW